MILLATLIPLIRHWQSAGAKQTRESRIQSSCPKARRSEGPPVRRPTSPNARQSEGPLVQKPARSKPASPKASGPKALQLCRVRACVCEKERVREKERERERETDRQTDRQTELYIPIQPGEVHVNADIGSLFHNTYKTCPN